MHRHRGLLSSLYAARTWALANASYRQLDALGTVPQDLQSKFDVIHTRLLLAAVKDANAKKLLCNLLSMLKPSGWLQWSEYDVTRFDLIKENLDAPSVATEKIEAELGAMWTALRMLE